MSQLQEVISAAAAQAADIVQETAGRELWTPAGAGELADPGQFGGAMLKIGFENGLELPGEISDGYWSVPTRGNVNELQAHPWQIVAVDCPDSAGAMGRFPGIILPSSEQEVGRALRVSVLNTAPGVDPITKALHQGDRLSAEGLVTDEQVIYLKTMTTTEAPGVGQHGTDQRPSSADIAHSGGAFVAATNPGRANNPHKLVPHNGGLSKVLAGGGLNSAIRNVTTDIITNPDRVYWHPNFRQIEVSSDSGASGSRLVLALGYAAGVQRVVGGAAEFQRNIVTQIRAIESSQS